MSAKLKMKLSRLGIIATLTVLCFAGCGSVVFAQGLGEVKGTAEALAALDTMQLFAYIAIAAIGSTVFVTSLYVRSVATAQKEAAAWMATIAAGQSALAGALHDIAENCNRKQCPR